MPLYAYVNGCYLNHNHAAVHIEDRGFQFADSVYEVIGCIHGILADECGHLDRLERSLKELQMDMPVTRRSLQFLMREVLRKNRLTNAALYIQITRGKAKRDFKFPPRDTTSSTLVITSRPFHFDNNATMEKGVKAITIEDIRWQRRDIKTVGLLAQVLAKQKAFEAGAYEALMLDEKGFITEGSSSNCFIVEGRTLRTRPATQDILKGVTRTAIENLVKKTDLAFREEPFTLEEAYKADEIFNTSATSLIAPIIELNGRTIGKGKPGPVACALDKAYRSYVENLKTKQYRWHA